MTNVDYNVENLNATSESKYRIEEDQYEVISKSHYDARSKRMIYKTEMVVSSNAQGRKDGPQAEEKVVTVRKDRTIFDVPKRYKTSKDIHNAVHALVETASLRSLQTKDRFRAMGVPTLTNLAGEIVPLTRDEAEHYFGEIARLHFFDRLRQLMAQMQQLAPFGVNQRYLFHQLEGDDGEHTVDDFENGSVVSAFTAASKSLTPSAQQQQQQNTQTSALPAVYSVTNSVPSTALASADDASSFAMTNSNSVLANAFQHSQPRTFSSSHGGLGSVVNEDYSINVASINGLPRMARTAADSHNNGESNASVYPPSVANATAVSGHASVTSAVQRLSQSFFDELQTISSNDHIKRKVDRDLLSQSTSLDYMQLMARQQHRNNNSSSNNKRHGGGIAYHDSGSVSSRRSHNKKHYKHVQGQKIRLTPLDIEVETMRQQQKQGGQYNSSKAINSARSSPSKIKQQSSLRMKDVNEAHKHRSEGGNDDAQSQLTLQTSVAALSAANGIEAWDELSSQTNPVPGSPRTKYIAGCLRAGLQPLPNILLRREFTTKISLAHFGMGDAMGCVLAQCISQLPHVESIDFHDNNLTDTSLKHLIAALIDMPDLRELNLSRNKIDGESSDAMAEWFARADCPIVNLILQNADIDDGECDRFVQCLVSNEKLLELDMSSNMLGSAPENSGERTGGEAIAEFLVSSSCRLKSLKLAWNSIRGTPATVLMQSLKANETLTYLDLNCNGLGAQAGLYLGDALIQNRTLQTLLINNNNLSASAVVSICIGITENLALKHVEMNENPIGIIGAKMIMQSSIGWGSSVHVDAKNCNTFVSDPLCWFDPTLPCQMHTLQLSNPYDRAVAFYLLHLVASHSTYVIAAAQYEATEKGKVEKLEFVQSLAHDREQFFDEEQKKIMHGLRTVHDAASNLDLATQMFYDADADGSGKLDKDELRDVLHSIGFQIDADRLNDIFAVFDVDGGGAIDLPEFIMLLKAQSREAAMRIKEMQEYPISCLAATPGVKYIPPTTGKLTLLVNDGFVQKSSFLTISTADQKFAYNMAKGIGDVSLMTEAVRNTKMRYDEAYALYKTLHKEIPDKAQVLLRVVPQMMFSFEARQLISKVTHDNRNELARVKLAFGVALRPMLGAYNGYYALDLSKEIDRLCLTRLLEQSQTWNSYRIRNSIIGLGKIGDVSQHGNWSCFRNEIFQGKPIEITPRLFTPMPHAGSLEFDFSGSTRPTGQELRMSDKRVCKVLSNLVLLPEENTVEATNKLTLWRKKASEKNREQTVFMPMYAFDPPKAKEAGMAMDAFYDQLLERQSMLRAGRKKEETKVVLHDVRKLHAQADEGKQQKASQDSNEDGSYSARSDSSSSSSGSSSSSSSSGSSSSGSSRTSRSTSFTSSTARGDDVEGEGDNPATNTHVNSNSVDDNDEDAGTVVTSDEVEANEDDDEDEENGELSAEAQENHQRQRIAEQRARLETLLHARRGVSMHAKAAKFLEAVEETFGQLWLYSRHVALIVMYFQKLFGNIGQSRVFGSYLVEMVVSLFGRIIDLHNFEIVLEQLDGVDCGCLFARLGLLNIFNPMKPEVTLELDMDRREERLLAKIIVYLSVVEPGINLTFKQFQWKREMDYIPGWELTDSWMSEEGMPIHGKLVFTYYSGEGKGKFGCLPDVFVRKALCAMVLVDENDVIDEEDSVPDVLTNTAEKHYARNKDVWISYLSIR